MDFPGRYEFVQHQLESILARLRQVLQQAQFDTTAPDHLLRHWKRDWDQRRAQIALRMSMLEQPVDRSSTQVITDKRLTVFQLPDRSRVIPMRESA